MASLGFTVAYDASVLTYNGFSQNSRFGTFNVNTGTAGQITMASTSASAAMNGFFRFATVRFIVSNSYGPTGVVQVPDMEWKWPSEHSVDCKDYHPRIGNGEEYVGGWDRNDNYDLQQACDSTDGTGYLSYQNYGVTGGGSIMMLEQIIHEVRSPCHHNTAPAPPRHHL